MLNFVAIGSGVGILPAIALKIMQAKSFGTTA
jgi:hypothetical protein